MGLGRRCSRGDRHRRGTRVLCGCRSVGGIGMWDSESEVRRELRARRGTIGGYPREGGAAVTMRLMASKKPVIMAVNGPAVGIGASITLPADVRIASDRARFGFVFARYGVVPDAAASWFLPRVVGITAALEWIATGRVFDAGEALHRGLVSRVVEHDQLLPSAVEVAQQIASTTSPVAVAATRRLLWRGLAGDSPWDAHRLESEGYAVLGGSADTREGIQAFLDGRVPHYPSRVQHGPAAVGETRGHRRRMI